MTGADLFSTAPEVAPVEETIRRPLPAELAGLRIFPFNRPGGRGWAVQLAGPALQRYAWVGDDERHRLHRALDAFLDQFSKRETEND